MMISEDQTSPLLASEQPESDVVLSVQGVSKKFCRSLRRSLFYGIQDIAGELTGSRRQSTKLRSQEFWALDDVSFDLHRGEAIGLIGVNGSGKTTLLRIISGLIKPDRGCVKIWGQIAPLIALGAGFSPVLTGRENVYANMSILGLTKKQIDDRFEEVVDFAELWDAIDAPVQSYSSGMAARLGFACAIHTDPDILLIDEVLAVGDARFRSKCERRLADLLKQGTSFVLVSHSFQNILNSCTSAVYLSKGRVLMVGNARDVMNEYEKDLFSVRTDESTPVPFVLPPKPPEASTGVDLLSIYFKNSEGKMVESPRSGEPTYICAHCRSHRKVSKISLFIAIYQPARDNSLALHVSSAYDEESFEIAPGEYELRAYFPYLGLLPGSYSFNIYLKDGSIYVLDLYESFKFTVQGQEKMNRGLFYQPREWQIAKQ